MSDDILWDLLKMHDEDRKSLKSKMEKTCGDRKEGTSVGDDPEYRKGHADGVQEVRDYMIKQVGYCHFGE